MVLPCMSHTKGAVVRFARYGYGSLAQSKLLWLAVISRSMQFSLQSCTEAQQHSQAEPGLA